MNTKLFTIGEVAKLHAIPIKTLRYYDEIDLLKPAYTDLDTGYRYYSVEQFILIDVIKNSKIMGMSLNEIRNILADELTIVQMESMLEIQIQQYQQQIEALQQTKVSMERYLQTIQRTKQYPLGEIVVTYEPNRYYRSYPYVSSNHIEAEINLRKAFLDADSIQDHVYPVFGATSAYKQFHQYHTISYRDIREYIRMEQQDSTNGIEIMNSEKEKQEVMIIPAGKYLTVYFDEPAEAKKFYYEKLEAYIVAHHIQVKGDYNETWLVPRVDKKQQERTLVRLDIQI